MPTQRAEPLAACVFNRPLTPKTLIHHTWIGDPKQADDANLIKAYRYAKFTNYFIRYWSQKHYPWTTNELILLNQMGGDDYILAMIHELQQRNLFKEADNDYLMGFE